MDMRWFDDVLVLLEERNLTRAAARQNISQPAFSRRIRSFEDWLGIQILERKTNRIEISPALVSNEAEIRALVAHLRELRTRIAQFDPAGSTVAIAAQSASVYSGFPEMAQSARAAFPAIRFRLRAGNLKDCLTLFLRGETGLLLYHETQNAQPVQFGADVRRGSRGQDALIPVIGGALWASLPGPGVVPADTPSIVYPDNSYFGEVLGRNQRPFATAGFSRTPVCQTASTSGIKALVLGGLGIGWLPLSMARHEIDSGALVSLATELGTEPLDVAIYAHKNDEMAVHLVEFWTQTA